MKKKLYIFYTINQQGDWKQVMSSQVTRLIKSGLFDDAVRVFCAVYGMDLSLSLPQKFSVIQKSNDSTNPGYEFMDVIQNFASNNDCYILNMSTLKSEYFGRANYPHVQEWREYVEHFNISSWKECVSRLEHYDAVGVDWHPNDDGTGGFDGNFWWSKSSYLSKLGKIDGDINQWIGTGKPRVAVLFNSGIDNHMRIGIPKEQYLGGPIAPVESTRTHHKREPVTEQRYTLKATPKVSSAPPLVPIIHNGPPPPLYTGGQRKSQKSAYAFGDPKLPMKLLMDCTKGIQYLPDYVSALVDSKLYDKFTVRVAIFGSDDYEPIKNFICYGKSMSGDVIASMPIGVDSHVMYADVSSAMNDSDREWIMDWQKSIKQIETKNVVGSTDDVAPHLAWERNSSIGTNS